MSSRVRFVAVTQIALCLVLGLSLTFADSVSTVSFTRHRLSNGLRIVIVEDRTTPYVEVLLAVNVGTSPHGELPHLIEHLLVRSQIAALDTGGPGIGGTTQHDSTVYAGTFAHEQLERALFLLATITRPDKPKEHALDAAKASIHGELNTPGPSDLRWVRLIDAVQARQGIALPIFTSAASVAIDAVSPTEASEFVRSYYGPNNVSVVIVGDVRAANALALVRRQFGRFRARPVPREPVRPMRPSMKQTRVNIEALPGETRIVCSAFVVPSARGTDYAALTVMRSLLAKRISAAFKGQPGVPPRVVSNLTSDGSNSNQLIFAAFAAENTSLRAVERVISAQIEDFKKQRPSAEEMQRVVDGSRLDMLSEMATGPGHSLARYDVVYDNPALLNFELRTVTAVTPDDVQRVARTYLTEANRVAGAVASKTELAELSTEQK